VSCRGFGVERIPSLQHSMLLHLVPLIKRIWNVRVQGGLHGALCLEVLLKDRVCLLRVLSLTPNCYL
jgi:hypothetical protein